MEDSIRRAVKTVIEETSMAYRDFSDFNSANADFADFAGMALPQFKNALRNPDLTREDLEVLLRRGMNRHRTENLRMGWEAFIASYITRASNQQVLERV